MTGLAGRAVGAVKRLAAPLVLACLHYRYRDAPLFRPLEGAEFGQNERALEALGVAPQPWRIDPAELDRFRALHSFPPDYHGGVSGRVWDEKLLEHFVAWSMLDLNRPGMVYLDIAGASSPWATLLRRRGLDAFSVDMNVHERYRSVPYYVQSDATRLPWSSGSVEAMSLQCAYELFIGDSDTRFVTEAARVLKPGGKVVIVPLYMHTHPCYYATPDYYGRSLGDAGATKYLWKNSWGVPASRKYSAQTLMERVLRPARACGLRDSLFVLANPEAGGSGIYLRYILVLSKPA